MPLLEQDAWSSEGELGKMLLAMSQSYATMRERKRKEKEDAEEIERQQRLGKLITEFGQTPKTLKTKGPGMRIPTEPGPWRNDQAPMPKLQTQPSMPFGPLREGQQAPRASQFTMDVPGLGPRKAPELNPVPEIIETGNPEYDRLLNAIRGEYTNRMMRSGSSPDMAMYGLANIEKALRPDVAGKFISQGEQKENIKAQSKIDVANLTAKNRLDIQGVKERMGTAVNNTRMWLGQLASNTTMAKTAQMLNAALERDLYGWQKALEIEDLDAANTRMLSYLQNYYRLEGEAKAAEIDAALGRFTGGVPTPFSAPSTELGTPDLSGARQTFNFPVGGPTGLLLNQPSASGPPVNPVQAGMAPRYQPQPVPSPGAKKPNAPAPAAPAAPMVGPPAKPGTNVAVGKGRPGVKNAPPAKENNPALEQALDAALAQAKSRPDWPQLLKTSGAKDEAEYREKMRKLLMGSTAGK